MIIKMSDVPYILDKVKDNESSIIIVYQEGGNNISIPFPLHMNEWEKILQIIKRIDGVLFLGNWEDSENEKMLENLKIPFYRSWGDFFKQFEYINKPIFICKDAEALLNVFNVSNSMKNFTDIQSTFNNSELHFLPLTFHIPLPYTLPSIEGKEQLIPKKIHYGWFGGDKKPPLVEYCIQSWYKHHPGWEIIEWNEHNIDMNKNDSMRYFNEGKYTDLPDIWKATLLQTYGGIYLDTDMEVIKPLDRFLYTPSFSNLRCVYHVDRFVFGATPNDITTGKDFGKFQNYVSDGMNTLKILDDGSVIYPTDVFTTRYQMSGAFEYFTENTHAIHHNTSAWVKDPEERRRNIWLTVRQRKILRKIFNNNLNPIPDHLTGMTKWIPEEMEYALNKGKEEDHTYEVNEN